MLGQHRNDISKHYRFFNLSNIFNLMTIEDEVKLAGLYTTMKHLLSGMVSRAKDEGFKDLKLLDNIQEAVLLYADSPLPDIRNAICILVLAMAHKINKFYFNKYPEIIFALCKSEYYP